VFKKAVPTQDVTDPVSLPSYLLHVNVPFFLDPMKYFIIHTIDPTDLINLSPAPHFKTVRGTSYPLSMVFQVTECVCQMLAINQTTRWHIPEERTPGRQIP
jgi:hypothetical protein